MGNLIVQHFKSPEKVQIQNWLPSMLVVYLYQWKSSVSTLSLMKMYEHTHRNNNYNNLTIPYLWGKQNSRSDFNSTRTFVGALMLSE